MDRDSFIFNAAASRVLEAIVLVVGMACHPLTPPVYTFELITGLPVMHGL